jgi:hypothetical protein
LAARFDEIGVATNFAEFLGALQIDLASSATS